MSPSEGDDMLIEDAFRLEWLRGGLSALIRFAHSLRGSVSVLRGFSEYARGGVLMVLFPVAAPDFGGIALEGRFGIIDSFF